MTSTRALMVKEAGAGFAQEYISRRDLRANDVSILITHCGVCHSDIHAAVGEWGAVRYPLVPGHEIIGVVERIGPDVSRTAVGDRVGVGTMVDSCRACENCRAGDQQYCLDQRVGTYNSVDRWGESTLGGYSGRIVVDEDFLFAIPEELDSAEAAPLLCAGITVFSPLKHWKVTQGSRVTVIGLGGLGHLGVKMAVAFGAEVTVITSSEAKQKDALRLGAHNVHRADDKESYRSLRSTQDLIISTVSAPQNLNRQLGLLRRHGTLVSVGLSNENLVLHPTSLLMNGRSLASSNIGGIDETSRMLAFCAEHRIASDVEVVRPDYIAQAIGRVLQNDVRYRFVLDTADLQA